MFRFSLEIPLISIQTELMYQHYEMMARSYIAWQIRIWKWHWTLFWGKSREEEKSTAKLKTKKPNEKEQR
jgi:hypothetical protein